MLTCPALPAGAVAVIDVLVTAVTVAGLPCPKSTALSAVNPEPEIVTVFWPASGPASGVTAVTDGGPYMYLSDAEIADVPSGVVTVTLTCPAPPAGAVAVIDV